VWPGRGVAKAVLRGAVAVAIADGPRASAAAPGAGVAAMGRQFPRDGVPAGALVDVSAAIERPSALGGRRCCITVLVRSGRASHALAIVVFAARSGIEK